VKRISVCRVCGQSVSKALAYHAEVEKMIENPMTGAVEIVTMVGPICPECNLSVGYQTSKKKLEKFGKEVIKNASN